MTFRLQAICGVTDARAGLLATAHGALPTPTFMPVGTLATVKALTPRDLREAEAVCLLANAYHLALRPGAEVVARLGGLHRLMHWERPLLTDSGGFQVYSLAALRETDERGVRFCSHIDGNTVEFTPESVVRTQEQLGADLIMPLDICLGPEADEQQAAAALERTRRWALRSQQSQHTSHQQLFGIIQGGLHLTLRRQAAIDLRGLNFPGYAIGGLSVGEPPEITAKVLSITTPELPAERPRYLMGVGTPEQVLTYVALGIDMFDSVLPSRLGRTGVAFTSWERLNLKRAEFRADPAPIDPWCDCYTCTRYSRAFLHYTLRHGIALGARLLTIHNIRTLVRTAETARAAILRGTLPELMSQSLGDQRQERRPGSANSPSEGES